MLHPIVVKPLTNATKKQLIDFFVLMHPISSPPIHIVLISVPYCEGNNVTRYLEKNEPTDYKVSETRQLVGEIRVEVFIELGGFGAKSLAPTPPRSFVINTSHSSQRHFSTQISRHA